MQYEDEAYFEVYFIQEKSLRTMLRTMTNLLSDHVNFNMHKWLALTLDGAKILEIIIILKQTRILLGSLFQGGV